MMLMIGAGQGCVFNVLQVLFITGIPSVLGGGPVYTRYSWCARSRSGLRISNMLLILYIPDISGVLSQGCVSNMVQVLYIPSIPGELREGHGMFVFNMLPVLYMYLVFLVR